MDLARDASMLQRGSRILAVIAAFVVIGTSSGCDSTGQPAVVAPLTSAPPTPATSTPPPTTPTPTPTTTATPTARYTFAKSVPANQRAAVRQGIGIALAYIRRTVAPLQQDITVDVRGDNAGDCSRFTAYAPWHSNSIVVCAASEVWKGSTSYQRSKILVHEVFHIVQSELGLAEMAPNWLLEGSAEYVAYSAIIAKGLISRASANRELGLAGGLRGLAMRATLQSLETQSGFLESNVERREPTFALACGAVELLVRKSGLRSLRTFFSSLQPGVDWKWAFKSAFGTSASAFYERVATLRA